MAKVTITPLGSLSQGSAVNTINNNFQAIVDGIDLLLSRDGEAPNPMDADLDMNSQRILNLPEPQNNTEPVRKIEFDDFITFINGALQRIEDAAVAAAEAAVAASLVPFLNELGEATQEGLDSIEAAEDSALSEISSSRTSALNSIGNAANNAISAVGTLVVEAEEYKDEALQYSQNAKAASEAIGVISFYDTKALADAALGSHVDGDVIEVFVDETQGNARTLYVVESGVLVYKTIAGIDLDDLYTPSISGAPSRTIRSKLGEIVSAKDYGAKGDGVTDDTAAVQALIDIVSNAGGGLIYFPKGVYKLNIILKRGVSLMGSTFGCTRGIGEFGPTVVRYGTTFVPAVAGWIIDTPTGGVGAPQSGINGISFRGSTTLAGGGVYLRQGSNGVICRSMTFEWFQDEALRTDGLIGRFSDMAATNTLMNRARSERTGCFRFEGADNFIERIQGNTGITSVVSPDLFLCGIYIGGANNYALHLEGELSEIGVFSTTSGAHHKIVNSRADLNYGHGFVGSAMYSNCHSLNNSNGSPGVYSGFVTDGDANVQYSGCRAVGSHAYGFDLSGSNFSLISQRPHLDASCVSSGHVVAEMNLPASQTPPVLGRKTATVRGTGTTLNADGGVSVYIPTNTTPIEFTGITGGSIGQKVAIYGNGNVTLVNSSSFAVRNTNNSGKKTMISGRVYEFLYSSAGWVEIEGSSITMWGPTSDRPDSFARPGLQYFDTTLNKPIWRNAANSGWVDATGSSV